MSELMQNFMIALGQLEYGVQQECMEDTNEARAKVLSYFQASVTMQTDDPLVECYRIAANAGAPSEHLLEIAKLINARRR